MVAMFEALVASGLNGFLGCMSDISETALIEFYQTPPYEMLSVEGLIDINEVPKDLIFDARTEFSLTGHGDSRDETSQMIRYPYLYSVEKHTRFGVGRLRGVPSSKNSTAKTVGRYIAINDKIAIDNVEGLAGKSRVNKTPVKRAVFKKRPTAAIDEQVVKKKRTLKGKAAPSKENLELVSVAIDVEPIQTVDPTSADDVDTIIEQVVAETTRMDTNEELETVAFETSVEEQRLQTFVEPEAAEGTEMGIVLKDPEVTQSDNISVEVNQSPAATTAKEIVLTTVTDVGQSSFDEELLSIDDLLKRIPGDMMLLSILAAEPTKIKFGLGI
ncbi:hypothetical protein F511_43042 [Dorcoceras hygrometricum]|uniref:Uncharacterized protein n=1 Tax=Dorcoceras hygrometricum TaxID=472368 RepID=A0A2Z7C889_9LAMI|nr:hypothetical protein F511_43042 [Dorcoceras hygrometricum]